MQSSSEQPLVGEEHSVTTLITAVKETTRATLCPHIQNASHFSRKILLLLLLIILSSSLMTDIGC